MTNMLFDMSNPAAYPKNQCQTNINIFNHPMSCIKIQIQYTNVIYSRFDSLFISKKDICKCKMKKNNFMLI